MASKGSASNATRVCLRPSFAKDGHGLYVNVVCGKVSGQLYPDKMTKKSPGKCILVSGQWYTPSEVECLGGKRSSRKWKQSILHMGKQLADYDLSCSDCGSDPIVDASLSDSNTPSCNVQLSSDNNSACSSQVVPGQTEIGSVHLLPPCNTGSNTAPPLLVDTALSFIKAFRFKGDVDSLRMAVTERFSPKEVEAAKSSLWDCSKLDLEAKSFVFHVRRDSDKRSQLAANLDDILQMFDMLDSVARIPAIYCEASDLLRLPPLSLDPVGEQVQSNSQNLKSLTSAVERLENKLSSFLATPMQQSYAEITSAVPHPQTTVPLATSHSQSSLSMPLHKKVQKPSSQDSRESNIVLFGVPEKQSLVETKGIVDEIFEFLSGKQIQIRDMFRLGRRQQPGSSSRPRPLLIKLCTVWDRKLLLMRKTNLRDFHIKRLFLREDVAPDHKLRQKRSVPSQSNVVASQQCSTTSVTVEPPPTNTDNTPDHIPALHASKQGCLSGPQQHSSSLPLPELRHSGSPVTLSRSVSPSPASIASLSSSSTIIQGSESNYDGST